MAPCIPGGLVTGAYCSRCPVFTLGVPKTGHSAYPSAAESPVCSGNGDKLPPAWQLALNEYERGGYFALARRPELMTCGRPPPEEEVQNAAAPSADPPGGLQAPLACPTSARQADGGTRRGRAPGGATENGQRSSARVSPSPSSEEGAASSAARPTSVKRGGMSAD